MGLILGIDLCDSFSQISVYSPEKRAPEPLLLGGSESNGMISTTLCKVRGADRWLIGTEAYQRALMGEGTMVDKLVKILTRGTSATIEGVQYSAVDLMAAFIGQLIRLPKIVYKEEEIESIAFGLRQLDPDLLDRLTEACDICGLERSRVRFLSHTECFAYYVANQPKELWPNVVSAFDLNDAGLDYFEMKMKFMRNLIF